MSERQVSIDDTTYRLDAPFLVIATQNPLESHGTYPLPESQLDRFLMRISVGYPQRDVERAVLLDRGAADPVDSIRAVLTRDDVLKLQASVDNVAFAPRLADYVMDIVEVTRSTVRLAVGVSTRGALALQRAARAHALVEGREFVTPTDVKAMAVPVLSHRVSLGSGEQVVGGSRRAAESLMHDLVASVEVPI